MSAWRGPTGCWRRRFDAGRLLLILRPPTIRIEGGGEGRNECGAGSAQAREPAESPAKCFNILICIGL